MSAKGSHRIVRKVVISLFIVVAGGAVLFFSFDTPQFGRTDQARRVKALADIRGIEAALRLWKLDCGSYPTTQDGLESLVAGHSKGCQPDFADPYLYKVPIDPWGNRYVFVSDGQTFIIKSYGADAKEGGAGTDADIDSRDREAQTPRASQ